MQGIPVTGGVAQQNWRRLALPGRMADTEPVLEVVGPGSGVAESIGPIPCDRQQLAVERRAHLHDPVGHRVREVPVGALPEPVSGHVDRRAEPLLLAPHRGELGAFGRVEDRPGLGAAVVVELGGQCGPVLGRNAFCHRHIRRRGHAASRFNSVSFAATPPTYWPIEPSARTTRWHGITTGRGLRAQALPTARTARG